MKTQRVCVCGVAPHISCLFSEGSLQSLNSKKRSSNTVLLNTEHWHKQHFLQHSVPNYCLYIACAGSFNKNTTWQTRGKKCKTALLLKEVLMEIKQGGMKRNWAFWFWIKAALFYCISHYVQICINASTLTTCKHLW